MIEQEAILSFLRQDPRRVYTLHEILKKAGFAPDREKAAKRALKALVKSGALEREEGRRYRISRAGQEVQGRIGFDEQNNPLFYVEGSKTPPVYLASDEAGKIEAGDFVLASLSTAGKRGRLQARIIEILDRPKVRQLGVFRQISKATFVELEMQTSQQRRLRRNAARSITEVIVLPESSLGAQDGQLVEVEISRRGRGLTASAIARVVRVLGRLGERETEVQRLMVEHHLERHFPSTVEAEVARYGHLPSAEDIAGRRDLRDIPLVTIDGETAKDFDDAVCAIRHGQEGYKLLVAIADVSHYVKPETALDREAQRRGTSTYLTDRAIPMLPEGLSNVLCSLMPHVDRLCLVVELVLDRTGHVEKTDFYPAVMRSHARLTYERVAEALEGNPDEECKALLPTLLVLNKVASLLLERRLKRGAIDLDLAEPVVTFDANNIPIDIKKRPRNDAHRLIEDLMIAANEAVAGYFVDRSLASVFRIHEDPDPDKLEIFTQLCERLGVSAKLKRHPRPADIAVLLEKLSSHESAKPLNSMLLRSMSQARYDAECKGHFGLASERYLHFTSPIRRYPDLVVHRLLKAHLRKNQLGYTTENLQDVAQRSSDAERRAMMAERESIELDRAYVALEHLGETLPAVISAVQAFGLFAATDSPFLEGLLPVSALADDFYEIDDLGAFLRGASSGRIFMLGQLLEVEIASVNVARRQIELRLPASERTEGNGQKKSAGRVDGPRNQRDRRTVPRRGKAQADRRQPKKKK